MKLHTLGIVDADTVDMMRLNADETRTLQALCEAIYYCLDYEFATVAGAASLMREQRQEELMGAPYSCSRDDDERRKSGLACLPEPRERYSLAYHKSFSFSLRRILALWQVRSHQS